MSDLSGSFQKFKDEAKAQIRLWKGIGITSGIVAVGTLAYVLVNAVKEVK